MKPQLSSTPAQFLVNDLDGDYDFRQCTLQDWLWEGGLIWIAGAASAWAMTRHAGVFRLTVLRVAVLVLLAVALVLSRFNWGGLNDLTLGLSVAAAIPVLAQLPRPQGLYRLVARGLSELSFTLYLTHFPLLTLVVLAGLGSVRLPPGPAASVLFLGLLGLALIWATMIWWCFERNTDRVHGWAVGAISDVFLKLKRS